MSIHRNIDARWQIQVVIGLEHLIASLEVDIARMKLALAMEYLNTLEDARDHAAESLDEIQQLMKKL